MSRDLVFRKPTGAYIATACDRDYTNFDMTLVTNGIGRAYVTLPANRYPLSLFAEDTIMEVWHKPRGGAQYLEGQTVHLATNLQATSRVTELHTETANSLLKRRIVAYQSGAQEALAKYLNLPLDDMLKQIVRDNMGANAGYYANGPDSVRDLSAYLTVEANRGAWYSTDRRVASNILYDVATVNHEKSTHNIPGTEFFWDIVATNTTGTPPFLELRTYENQRATDRRGIITFSEAERSMINSRLVFDWGTSYSRVYAGGPGTGATRLFSKADDATLAANLLIDPFALREKFINAKKAESQTELDGEAEDAIADKNNQPYEQFTAQIGNSACMNYGTDFFFGDRCSAFFLESTYDVYLSSVKIHAEAGHETTEIQISSKNNLYLGELGELIKQVVRNRRDINYLNSIDDYA